MSIFSSVKLETSCCTSLTYLFIEPIHEPTFLSKKGMSTDIAEDSENSEPKNISENNQDSNNKE